MVKRPTIKDVAEKAGVSIATVSFVINDRPGQVISERVKKRVRRAAAELSYHPSATAVGLARNRTHNVAIVFYLEDHLVSNQFYSFVVEGAIKEAIHANYNLLFTYIPEAYTGEVDLPKVFRERNAEGAIFLQRVDPKLILDVEARGIPVVTVDHFPAMGEINTLQIDNRLGGQLAADHLLGLGHREIAFLFAAIDRPSIAERAEGFREAITKRGLRFSNKHHVIESGALTHEAGYAAVQKALTRKRPPTGLFCANDEMAAGALRAAHELGFAVPEELSVVGFDDVWMSNYTDPPLTTIRVDKEALGGRAMRRLLELVEDGERAGPPIKELVPVQLVERRSTASLKGS